MNSAQREADKETKSLHAPETASGPERKAMNPAIRNLQVWKKPAAPENCQQVFDV